MSYELLEQGQAENIAVIAASLIITMLAYCAFPLIFAMVRKKTITKKKYRILCYCVNFAVWMMFIAFNGTSSGAPYILWTAVFSALGVKMLKSKGALNECQPTDSTSSGAQSVDTCSVSDDMAVTEKSIPAIEEVPDTEEKPSNKFLQSCGSELTEDSPLCPSYGKKQDDKKPDGKDSINIIIPKRTITIVLLSVIFAGLLGFNVWQYNKISDLENERENIIKELERVQTDRDAWKNICYTNLSRMDELKAELSFYQKYIVFVEENSHCYHWDPKCEYFDSSSFRAFNVEYAIQKGYEKCPNCNRKYAYSSIDLILSSISENQNNGYSNSVSKNEP